MATSTEGRVGDSRPGNDSLGTMRTSAESSRAPASGEYFPTEDPFTGRTGRWLHAAGQGRRRRRCRGRKEAFTHWSRLRPSARARLLRQFADAIIANADRLAEIERRDNGKLAAEVNAQVRYLGDYFHYYAGLADKVQSHVIPTDKEGVFSYTVYEPKGVVAIITPWNSPLTLTSWKLAPALAAGCTAVIKPSEFTSASMIELAQIATAGRHSCRRDQRRHWLWPRSRRALVGHPDVAHIGFTGGEIAGRKIYEAAARGLKTVTLELGGKSPNIVFDDADLDQAIKGIVSGIFAATGQTCQAGSRLLVQDSIHDDVIERLIDFIKDAKIGDPADLSTQIGPVATQASVREDSLLYRDCQAGGRNPGLRRQGQARYRFRPVHRADDFHQRRQHMRVAQEEIFGPVLSVIRFKDEEDAVRIGNDVAYGLAAGVWTQSLQAHDVHDASG